MEQSELSMKVNFSGILLSEMNIQLTEISVNNKLFFSDDMEFHATIIDIIEKWNW